MNIKLHVPLLFLFTAAACVGGVDDKSDDETVIDPDELIGAGDRNITDFWPTIDLPYSENTKVLSFDMLRNEVERSTGHSWLIDGTDQWELNRSALGGADYLNTFDDDRTISQAKVVTIRKMAFSVCGDLVAAENAADSPSIFTSIKPNAGIDSGDATVSSQVRSLYQRFFLVAPTDTEVTESVQLLVDLDAQAGSSEAWRGLCGAYLTSMRFLSY